MVITDMQERGMSLLDITGWLALRLQFNLFVVTSFLSPYFFHPVDFY
jgi:hypothetical protein